LTAETEKGKLDQKLLEILEKKKPETVEKLISLVKENFPTTRKEIIESILRLQAEGKIRFKPQTVPPSSLTVYLQTGHALWYWATTATAVLTAIIVSTVPENLHPWVYVRYVLGAVFVLWLPGYSFIKALFPTRVPIKMSTENLETVERIALSLGMSIALAPIVGLLLNYTPWGIRLTPIVLSLLSLTLVFATAALIREYQASKQR
jgi:hypothetical protein